MEKNPWICGECRSTVSTRFAPAVASRSAMRRAVMEIRGSSFLSLRAYGKYGRTAVTRRAEACLSASSRINSSTMFSDRGGAAVCTTNTSCSRTFSSIFTLRFSFEKRVVVTAPGAMPRHLQISCVSAGCDDPAKTLSPCMSVARGDVALPPQGLQHELVVEQALRLQLHCGRYGAEDPHGLDDAGDAVARDEGIGRKGLARVLERLGVEREVAADLLGEHRGELRARGAHDELVGPDEGVHH